MDRSPLVEYDTGPFTAPKKGPKRTRKLEKKLGECKQCVSDFQAENGCAKVHESMNSGDVETVAKLLVPMYCTNRCIEDIEKMCMEELRTNKLDAELGRRDEAFKRAHCGKCAEAFKKKGGCDR